MNQSLFNLIMQILEMIMQLINTLTDINSPKK